MKKILLTFIFVITSSIAVFAQWFSDSDSKLTFSLLGGSDFAFLQLNSANRQYVYTTPENPFALGLSVDYKFNDYFSIRPGVFYAGKGGTMNAIYSDFKGNNTDVTDDYKLHYFEVPICFIGHLPLGDGADIFLGPGAYFAWALNGTNKQTLFDYDPVNQPVTFGKNGDFKSTDYGLTGVLGFHSRGNWSLSGNLDWGLSNIMQNNNTGFDASKFSTITFYLGFGYDF